MHSGVGPAPFLIPLSDRTSSTSSICYILGELIEVRFYGNSPHTTPIQFSEATFLYQRLCGTGIHVKIPPFKGPRRGMLVKLVVCKVRTAAAWWCYAMYIWCIDCLGCVVSHHLSKNASHERVLIVRVEWKGLLYSIKVGNSMEWRRNFDKMHPTLVCSQGRLVRNNSNPVIASLQRGIVLT